MPAISAGTTAERRFNSSEAALITPSLSEQITPVLPLRLRRNGITGLFFAEASDLHDRIEGIASWHDLKAGYGWECWLRILSECPNHLVARKYNMGGAVYNAPAAIGLIAEVRIKLRQ